ncbi:hypothetical protein BJY24_006150 [Nocardia transvalensis]|uniref:Regulator of septum formation n=1 Tax=Nocardia transvalensis TaxID=37333 RepID=A0A7W9UL61_9NOCA|nr:DUF4190 domain-containing protein [Nocardia transvalensis]MBB5917238.1 hypothetical protein [Nocardia transvalensis]
MNQPPPQGFPPEGTPPPGGYAPMPGGPGQFGPPPGQPPQQQGTNGFAIASLILGILGGFCLLGAVFGVIALVQIKKTGQRGRGLAIAGIALTAVWVAVGIIGAVAAGGSGHRDSAGEVTRDSSEAVTRLREGDCVGGIEDGKRTTSVSVTPCAQPHDGEVIAKFDLDRGSFPGESVVSQKAEERCTTLVETALANSSLIDQLQISFLYPDNKKDWDRDRGVTCLVFESSGGKLTGPVPR